MGEPWWRCAVVYQIYPRSFADADGDGVGDLEGIRRHLGHLSWLGVDALWLSPIFRSPMADFGYDVADYRDIDPLFGDLDAFDRLLADAHAHGIRVLLDWVGNHTSNQHPWFVASRSSRDDPKRDWYVWRDQPNNWVAAFGDYPAWTYDDATGQYYLHLFLPQQPDLNWGNPEVVAAMHDVLRFWLDRGVDGFRADVIHLIGKDPALPDDPPHLVGVHRSAFHDEPSTHELLRGIRKVLDGYPGGRMMVGEVNLRDSRAIAAYLGAGDELHLAFDFGLLEAPWDATAWRRVIEGVEAAHQLAHAWPAWALGNHDQPRQATRYGTQARARTAAVVLLTLRGTPFLYAGEELGLEDAAIPPDRVVDPGGRDGCRAPLPWDASPAHGWATAEPWLPWPPDADRRNALTLRDDATSILHLYRALLHARRGSAALALGTLSLLEAPDGVLAYRRERAGDMRVVLANFTAQPIDVAGHEGLVVEVSSDGAGQGQPFDARLGGEQAVVLR